MRPPFETAAGKMARDFFSAFLSRHRMVKVPPAVHERSKQQSSEGKFAAEKPCFYQRVVQHSGKKISSFLEDDIISI